MNDTDKYNNVRISYDYIVNAYNQIIMQQEKIAERANKLVLVLGLFVAGLSYGAANLVTVAPYYSEMSTLYIISIAIGLLSAFFIIYALLAAMKCSHIEKITIPETQGLARAINNPTFMELEHQRVINTLSNNINDAIEENTKIQDRINSWSKSLKWTPYWSVFCTAIFIIFTFSLRIAYPIDNSSALLLNKTPQQHKENQMNQNDEKNDKDKKNDEEKKKEQEKEKEKEKDAIIKDIRRPPRVLRGSDNFKDDINLNNNG